MRIIPLTLLVLLLSLGLRAYSIVTGGYRAGESVVVTSSIAAEEEAEEEEVEEEAEEAEDSDEEEGATDTEEAIEEKVDDTYKPDNLIEELKDPNSFSQIEIDLLQSLSKRREELESRNRQLDMREEILRATELKIDEKIGEMAELKTTLIDLLEKYNEKEQEKIDSLVKIYSNMKPKEAARIFDELEMEILLQVVDLMQERKVAPILAKMTPKRAQEVTEQLADERRLPAIDPTIIIEE